MVQRFDSVETHCFEMLNICFIDAITLENKLYIQDEVKF